MENLHTKLPNEVMVKDVPLAPEMEDAVSAKQVILWMITLQGKNIIFERPRAHSRMNPNAVKFSA